MEDDNEEQGDMDAPSIQLSDDEPAQEATDILPLLLDLKRQITNIEQANQQSAEQMSSIERRISDVEGAGAGSATIDNAAGAQAPTIDLSVQRGAMALPSDITPNAMREDTDLMARATQRLARVRAMHEDNENDREAQKSKAAGKKSGCMLVSTENVLERIDWPHMYVTRFTGGKRKGVPYDELTMDEFVFGFVSMLESPFCKWDYRAMGRILRTVMQDSINFSWPIARAIYEMIGVDVEKGLMDWTDSDLIREMRFNHAQTLGAEKREAKETVKPQPRQAPVGSRCCGAYQTKTCEQTTDHPPFSHACAYCLRVCGVLYRHSEADCIRRVADAAKNGKKRE